MAEIRDIAIVSDIHYACDAEKARGAVELTMGGSRLAVMLVRAFRWAVWRRDSYAHNYLLDRFLERAGQPDLVIGNGDYSCDTAFIGVSDPAAHQSARECLDKLRGRFGAKLRLTLGDHELGKTSMLGGRGGLRLASWSQATGELGIEPFWRIDIGRHVLLGIASTVIALPALQRDVAGHEAEGWRELQEQQWARIRDVFQGLSQHQRVILFCHDPTALPFLGADPVIQQRLGQIEQTIIGHLHSDLFLWKSRLLSGMPRIDFMGHSVQRMSGALSKARYWKPFRVKLCPSTAGIQLLKDGGYLTMHFEGEEVRFRNHRLNWEKASEAGRIVEGSGQAIR